MKNNAEILIVDYENNFPKGFQGLEANGYHIKVVFDNIDASEQAADTDLIIMITNERRRECLKLMEHVRRTFDSSINFILIMDGGEDAQFQERVDVLAFQYFKKYRFSTKELLKSIHNAIEMRNLKVNERKFMEDLNTIEEELKKVENRLFTMTRIRGMMSSRSPNLN